uniref:SH2 domain-containing protein n=1 Tax=Trichuris muris TaxID=70415 RepID=A0A5S6Q928_TRIMR
MSTNCLDNVLCCVKVDSQRSQKDTLAGVDANENLSMHAYASHRNNPLDMSVWQHHPTTANNLPEEQVEIPVVTDVRGKRASIDIVTEGNLPSITPSDGSPYTWSSGQRKEHSGYRMHPPALLSRKVTDSNYGPFESPYRQAVIPPSRRALSPVKYHHLRQGALSPAAEKSDIDVDLVGEDRYDPQSRAFSYVPAQSLVEHFRSPKKPTKLVATYKYTHGQDASAAAPEDAADWVQSLETPTDIQQQPLQSVQQPNFDDLCNPNFYLNFGGSAEEPIWSAHTELSTIPRSWSAPAAVSSKANKPAVLNNLPALSFHQPVVPATYKQQKGDHPQQVDQAAVEARLTPTYRSYQDDQLNRMHAEPTPSYFSRELTKAPMTASVQQPLFIDQRNSPFLSPQNHFPFDKYESHFSKRSESARSPLCTSNGFLLADQCRPPSAQCVFASAEGEAHSAASYVAAERDPLLLSAFQHPLYMADQRDQGGGSIYGSSLPSDWSVSSATNAESWLDKQMQKLKLRQELTDPHLRRRREQERLLLEELKQVHEDRVARSTRQESDYTVEGLGSKSGPSGGDDRSLYAVVSKVPTPVRDSNLGRVQTGPDNADYPGVGPLLVTDGSVLLSPVDHSTPSALHNGIGNSHAYPRPTELQNSDTLTPKLLSSPKSILKKSKPAGAQSLLSPVADDAHLGQQGSLGAQLNDGSYVSRNYASPSNHFPRPSKVRSDTPSFPLRRMETPLPYHPLLYADAGGADAPQNRVPSRVGPAYLHSGSIRSPSPGSHYYAHSVRSSLTSLLEPMDVVHHHPVFVKDTSKYWYKPSISREEAISVLKDKQPGAFIIRDSNSFPGAFGLALKVAVPPPGVLTKSNDRSELVRHFLIETTAKGVKLKGCNNEPVFGSLAALVYQHSMTPLALPCKLLLPEYDPALSVEQITTAQQLLDQGAACNVTYLFSNETESLTGPEAVRRTVDVTLTTAAAKKLDPIVVHLKVSSQGITITDNARKKFFRRHYPVPTITHCSVDPENRQWSVAGAVPATIFGFVARKSVAKSENVCHIFAELEPEQPASAIVNFISRVILSPRQIIASD